MTARPTRRRGKGTAAAPPDAPPDTARGGMAAGGPVRRLVAFRVGATRFALPLTEAEEIIRRPEVVRIPLSPPSLEGLARRRGAVLPVISLRRVLGQAGGEMDGEGDGAGRVVVVGHRGHPVGLAVDRVDGVLAVEASRIDASAPDDGAGDLDAAVLAGAVRDAGGGVAALMLAAGALIDRQFAGLARPLAPAAGLLDTGAAATAAAIAAEMAAERTVLVSFDVAGQEFALPIAHVERIVPVPDAIARMPKARAHLLGVAAIRNELVPLLDLRALFGLDGAAPSHPRVVVTRIEGATGEGAAVEGERVGLVVDAVREILRVDPAAVGPVPAILAREAEFEDLSGIVRLDQGRRLVSVLSAERLLTHTAALAAAFASQQGTKGEGAMTPDATADHTGTAATEPFVVFRLGGAEYGLPVAAVQEVLRRPDDLTPLPKAPEFVAGLANLRGGALPAVDLRRVLRLPAAGAERQRIVVTILRDARVGLIVDAVSGVVRVPSAAIEPAPAVSEAQRQLINRVAHLDSGGQARMILLLETDALFDLDQLAALLETA
ncbi:chemotaxis protein CheW [Azospirillum sp.]|uniref:chemotaxis protein CheW n=1 Tax=Azospirillum sp. TaxID=34012 RepID=UPI002D73013B|nr:chemotaxis protein CheW [Azospirillum sp.]HYD67655.1 chemotaxis protein CheW [Azospirillum sp.]